ncbi:carboxypeptidase-like regulatory domain-containing protein [Lewinella sp. IMCC34183]|uniref:carboxypeptidase-like regulatory domain-containing protein n=1 Tax=Lewinella sp. IMCC34183 TaxID=2248762 RepID=UPI001300846F|nr:carboxypeptidase-like regulatory domain-containing protein [Lewinella sp. IMCC34183]
MKHLLFLLAFPLLAFGQDTGKDSTNVIAGKITDTATGEGIAYATVYCGRCTYGGTVTSAEGDYVLTSPVVSPAIRVDHIMYRTLETTVGEGRSDLRLAAEVHELPEVVVDGTEALKLVEAAYARLAGRADRFYRGEGFYRQTTRMNEEYSELFEYFVDLKYSNQGIADWKVKTGRYAVNPIPDRLLFENQSYFTRGWKVHNDAYDPAKFTIPLNPATYRLYDYRIAGRIQKESGEVILIDAFPTDESADGVIGARLYIFKKTATLLQADYTLTHLNISQPQRGVFGPAGLTASIRFRTANAGDALIQSMTTQTTFPYHADGATYAVEVKSLFLNFSPKTMSGTVDAVAGLNFADLKEVSRKKYRAKWWDRHPVVAATPVEQAVIDNFNRADYFGNYFDETK